MQTIKAMVAFPNGTPIDAVQARITKVYPRKEIETAYGNKTIQDGYLEDGAGGKIKFKAWSHPDLASLEGKEFVIHADGKGKGLKIVHDNYNDRAGQPVTTILLEVGKAGQFQHVAVFHQTKGTSEAPAAQGIPAPTSAHQSPVKCTETAKEGHPGKTFVHGATAGAAANKAVDILVSSGQAVDLARAGKLEEAIVHIGGQFVRAAQRLENGDFGQPTTPVVPIGNFTPSATQPAAYAPASKAELEEDVPF